MLRRLLALSLILLASAGCTVATGCGSGNGADRCIRVLFLGNSYTYVNDLPSMVAAMARAGGFRVETAMVAVAGATLADLVSLPQTAKALSSSKWDVVVLQEHSEPPSIEQFRQDLMYPAARQLVAMVAAAGAKPMFFMTWVQRGGWPQGGLSGYEAMQSQVVSGYLRIARELNVPVAPVGAAWQAVTRYHPQLNLWQADGNHPTEAGSYLAACVFYAAILRHSPVGSTYVAGLTIATAQLLQAAAGQTVLTNPGPWNLP